ncbi:MAG: hypothetical protein J5825_08050 [Lachnospiraceae bacterium]|nr:hypothetical protein [Lachnospiraceae bacterium]
MRIEAEKTEEEVKQLAEERAAEKKRKEKTKVRYSPKEEWARFKEQPGEEKFWYIWEYYKIHILVLILAVIVAVIVVQSVIEAVKPTVLQGFMVNTDHSATDTTFMTDGYLSDRGYNVKKNKLFFDDSLVLASDTGNVDAQMALASSTKVIANIQASDLDYMILDENALNQYCGENILADLETALPEDLFNRLKEEDRLVKANQILSYKDDMEEIPDKTREIYAGILMNPSPMTENLEIETECYYTLVFNSKRKDVAIDYLYYLLDGPQNSTENAE